MFSLLPQMLVAERDRWSLWVPVLMGVGISFYFWLPNEPPLVAALIPLAILLALLKILQVARYGGLGALALQGVLCIAVGFAAAKVRTERVDAPVLEREVRNATIEGRIIAIKPGSDGFPRLIIRPDFVSRLKKDEMPKGLRLSYRGKAGLAQPGLKVRFRATLMPPPGPVVPHGFDFARQSWFDGLGGVGYIVSNLELVEQSGSVSVLGSVAIGIARARARLADRLRAALPGERGAIAAALITGDRSGIPPARVDALRNSGLAHLLAISGLHMGMAGYAIFSLVRMVLAAIPVLALRYPVKKWAAAFGLAGAATYLVISGAPISAQRAFIMLGFVFVAVLVDRPAFTLRNVALAAIGILLLQPESLMEAGFQMSFAACTVLVSGYEARRKWMRTRPQVGTFVGGAGEPLNLWHWAFTKSSRYLGGILMTSFLAGVATAPFAVYHFNQFANLGLVANLLAVPVMGAFVMPPAVLGLLLMPLGLEAWPLAVMGFGIDQVLWVATEVAAKDYSISSVPSWPPIALAVLVMGALWLALWSRRWRLGGVVGIAIGLALGVSAPKPDLLIGREGKNIAILSNGGSLDIMKDGRKTYVTDTWKRRTGERPRKTSKGKEETPFKCDRLGCAYQLADGRTLVHVSDPRAFFEDCRMADIIVTNLAVPKTCLGPQLIVDKWDIRDGGAHIVRFIEEGFSVTTSQAVRGNRPWSGGG